VNILIPAMIEVDPTEKDNDLWNNAEQIIKSKIYFNHFFSLVEIHHSSRYRSFHLVTTIG
jgi:hypothetical protein